LRESGRERQRQRGERGRAKVTERKEKRANVKVAIIWENKPVELEEETAFSRSKT
jgi:hypothetical protein